MEGQKVVHVGYGKPKAYKKKGHIPGAVHLNTNNIEGKPDWNLLADQKLENNFEELGISADKKLNFFCGTGWRASEAFFAAHLMGWKDISVYDGGWYVWSNNGDNPVESGTPKQ